MEILQEDKLCLNVVQGTWLRQPPIVCPHSIQPLSQTKPHKNTIQITHTLYGTDGAERCIVAGIGAKAGKVEFRIVERHGERSSASRPTEIL